VSITAAAAATAAGRSGETRCGGRRQDSHRIAVPISYIIIITHARTLCVYIYIHYICSVGGDDDGGGGGRRRRSRRLRCSRQQQLNANETSNIQGGNDCGERSTSSPLYGRRKKNVHTNDFI